MQRIPIWTLKRKVPLRVIPLEVSQCQDNIGTSLDAPHQVRWLKISAQKGKKRVDLLLAICIQKALSQAIGGRIGKAQNSPANEEWQEAVCSQYPRPGPGRRAGRGAKCSFEATVTFSSFLSQSSVFQSGVSWLRLPVGSLQKSSINWTTLQEGRSYPEWKLPLKGWGSPKHSLVSHWWDVP